MAHGIFKSIAILIILGGMSQLGPGALFINVFYVIGRLIGIFLMIYVAVFAVYNDNKKERKEMNRWTTIVFGCAMAIIVLLFIAGTALNSTAQAQSEREAALAQTKTEFCGMIKAKDCWASSHDVGYDTNNDGRLEYDLQFYCENYFNITAGDEAGCLALCGC